MLSSFRCLLSAFALAVTTSVDAAPDQMPFAGKVGVTEQIFVDNQSQFTPTPGLRLPTGKFDSTSYERWRLGTISVGTSIRIHIEAIQDLVHFPSYFELVDAANKRTLGSFPTQKLSEAVWYFSYNGFIYLNQPKMGLCGARYTRKFQLRNRSLEEVPQPFYGLQEPTIATRTTPLFDSPQGRTVVATLAEGSTATAIGIQYAAPDDAAAILVRTPFGLIGWHRRIDKTPEEGSLQMYECN